MNRSLRPLCFVLLAFVTLATTTNVFGQGAQQGGGNEGASGGLDGGGLSSEFDTGADLVRTERRGRDTSTFVGAAAPTTGDFGAVNQEGTGLGAGNQAQRNPFNNFFNQFNQFNQFNNQQNQRNQLRIPLRLGFAKPPRPATQPVMARELTSAMQVRFNRLERFGPNVTVTLDGNTAVLTGSVGDEDSRRLAGRIVMLEPGVTAVRNDLEVVSASRELLPPAR